ncbi:MAG: SET domain-containing protein [Granulosicoccus sp.]
MSKKANKPKKHKDTGKSLQKQDKPGMSSAEKKSREKAKSIAPRTAKLMSRFKKARPSDVSDKVFVATSPVHGKGLFAAKRIKANTVLGRLHGMPTFDDGIYVLWITDELGLELTNDFKYINHNSKPNAAYSDLDVVVLKDVEPGEELLHDYGW